MGDRETAIGERFRLMAPQLKERQRRRFAASEARTFGRGGIAAAARACGMAENTVRKGLAELDDPGPLEPERVRSPGGGRKPATESDPRLLDDLRALVEGDTRGDPERVLLWTSKSLRNLAEELCARDHQAGKDLVGRLSKDGLGFSLQGARNTLEANSTPIATRSSSTSTRPSHKRSGRGSRRSASIPRRGAGRRVQERWPGVASRR